MTKKGPRIIHAFKWIFLVEKLNTRLKYKGEKSEESATIKGYRQYQLKIL